MPFPHEKHPTELREAVGQAILGGQTGTAVVRDLAQGTFPGFGPYVMPLQTARYYGQVARKREAAAGLSPRAKGDLSIAIESMAREVLSEVDAELHKLRRAKARDMEKLGAVVKLLKECKALVPQGASKPQATAGTKDPFAQQLKKAGKAGSATRAVTSQPQASTDNNNASSFQREGGEGTDEQAEQREGREKGRQVTSKPLADPLSVPRSALPSLP